MGITEVLQLLGGLALFLYGMQMMSTGLETAAGNKMKTILEKLTSNRFVGVLAGAIITAVIQSSSATTVMVVGFVNSGLMTLRQVPISAPPSQGSSSRWTWELWRRFLPLSAWPVSCL